MRCLWKVVIPPELKPGNQLSCRDDLGYMDLYISFCGELGGPLYMGRGSRGISVVSLGSQMTCQVGWGMRDGSGANAGESGLILCSLRYTDIFRVAGVNSTSH